MGFSKLKLTATKELFVFLDVSLDLSELFEESVVL